MIDKDSVKKNFSRAKNYDGLTSYHNLTLKMIAGAVMQYYSKNYAPDGEGGNRRKILKILDMGCGTAAGYFAVKNALPDIRFDYTGMDFAEGLLGQAKAKLAGEVDADGIFLVCGDAEYPPFKDKKFDIIFSNMTLQWLNNPDNFIKGCAGALEDGGIIILSFLVAGTLKELKDIYAGESMGKYAFRQLHSFPEKEHITDIAERKGLKTLYSESMDYVEYGESSAKLLKKINMLGAKNAEGTRGRDAASLRRILAAYDSLYKKDGSVYCTYKIAYLMLSGQRPD